MSAEDERPGLVVVALVVAWLVLGMMGTAREAFEGDEGAREWGLQAPAEERPEFWGR